jgi:hypothetical protein
MGAICGRERERSSECSHVREIERPRMVKYIAGTEGCKHIDVCIFGSQFAMQEAGNMVSSLNKGEASITAWVVTMSSSGGTRLSIEYLSSAQHTRHRS